MRERNSRAAEPHAGRDDAAPASGIVRQGLPLATVPRRCGPAADVRGLPLDHRAGFVLWLIDGRSSIADIFDVCAMPVDEAWEILRSLAALGVITFT